MEGQICSNPFSLNIAELIAHWNGEKKSFIGSIFLIYLL